jgi:peptidoglycan biosynthesis protein MviN/MurJ (putative lipid II flippase)
VTTTAADPVSRWILDLDGDTFGDERERIRWYEGTTVAANLQWIAVPLVAAVLVWILGRPSVLPLAAVLAVMYLTTVLVPIYVQRRRVDPRIARWRPSSVLRGSLAAVPYLAFVLGAMRAYSSPERHFLPGAAYGTVVGLILAVAVLAIAARMRRRREAAILRDED